MNGFNLYKRGMKFITIRPVTFLVSRIRVGKFNQYPSRCTESGAFGLLFLALRLSKKQFLNQAG